MNLPSSDSYQPSYALEKTENFRLVAKIFSSPSKYILKPADLAPPELQRELSEIGQFAELSHGKLSPKFIWEHMDRLLQDPFPLAKYDALRQSELASVFHGKVSNLQGYIARRPNQLIISFSGTSNFQQVVANVNVRLVAFRKPGCTIHAGFWRLYQGIREHAFAALAEALQGHDVLEVVFTGHSLGAVMGYLMALEMMEENLEKDASPILPPTPKVLTIAVFGCPRAGNLALVQHWRGVVEAYVNRGFTVREYSVKAFNDGERGMHPTPELDPTHSIYELGVPSIPPRWLGYCHFAQKPLYFVKGCLYQTPSTESESGLFVVQAETPEGAQGCHPRGGHNYYNSRDMERVLRTMALLPLNEPDWDGYVDRLRASGENTEQQSK